MPRKGKTLSGAPAGGAKMPVDSTYGEGEAALESQRRMPVPDFAKTGPGGTGGRPSEGGGAPPSGAGGPDPRAAALEAARAMAPPTSVLSGPTERPTELLTKGLPPRSRVQPDEALIELRAIAQRYPYPDLIALLERASREA